jgi:hypothetical protein
MRASRSVTGKFIAENSINADVKVVVPRSEVEEKGTA